MTVFDLDESKGVWFDMDGGGRVKLKTLTPSEWKAIRKQTVKKRDVFKKVEGKAERFEYEDVNEDLQNELFWDAIIVDWENLYDAKEAAILCNRENKILLMDNSQKFASFIVDSLKTLSDSEAAQAEASEKN